MNASKFKYLFSIFSTHALDVVGLCCLNDIYFRPKPWSFAGEIQKDANDGG
jgi:hypothetical protein